MICQQFDLPEPDMMDHLRSLLEDYRKKYPEKETSETTLVFGIGSKDEKGLLWIGERKNNRTEPALWEEIKRLMVVYFPDFGWNQTYIHMNWPSTPHKDKMDEKTEVLIIGFGDYEGGNLMVKDDEGIEHEVETKNRVSITLGGRYLHWNQPITSGFKYSFCITSDIKGPLFGTHPKFC